MTDMLEPRAMGRDRVRHDARAKVTGAALYAGDHPVERPAHLHLLQASIGRGRVSSVDASDALALDGVMAVITHENAPQLTDADDAELAILQSSTVTFRGQIIGAVLADTPEVARQAAGLVRVVYDVEAHDVDLRADRHDLDTPEEVNAGYPTDTDHGDVDAAFDAAPRRVDQTYRTPLEVNNPMEPHATTATWSDATLTLHDSTQGVHSVRVVDGWRVGVGVATSTYPVHTMPGSVAKVRSEGEGHYGVHIGAVDIGTGTWTALAQIAADALDVAVECIDLEIGDTSLPRATVAGGSSGIGSWGSAIVAAARKLRAEHGDHPPDGVTAESEAASNSDTDQYAMRAFGAQFAEVRVHCDTGEIRVPRMLGVFAVGRIVNPRTARSQLIGGMTMGLSMALHEQAYLDRATGHIVNHDLAEYHIAAHADVADIEAIWVDEEDPHLNPMGTKGIGEIGIVGAAAAIANAAFAATGTRVRELPLTADRYLP